MRKHLWFTAVILFVFAAASSVAAHGYILRAIPADRVVLERAPTRLQYWFSEDLEPAFSSINVRDQRGEIIASGEVDDEDASLMAVRLPTGLSDGAYIVELRPAFASDGHVVAESRVFFVGDEVGGVAGQSASDQAVPLEVVWRVLVLSSTMLLFGVFTLYTLILLPAWDNPAYRAGGLPDRVMHRLNRIVIAGLLLAFTGNSLALVQQTMIFFNVDAIQVIEQNLWAVVRIGSRFGDVWNARMLLLLVITALHAAGLYYRRAHPQTVRAFWSANAWLMALVVGSLSVASHAAGALLWVWLAMTADWLHALGVAFWVGGLMALVLILPPALRPHSGKTRRQALLAVMRRFSRLAGAAVIIVIVTGLYSALTWLYTPADLTQTTYGAALILKGLLVALLLLVAALHHAALNPSWVLRLERLTSTIPGALRRRLIRLFYRQIERAIAFAATLRLEALLALVVLITVSLLSATPVPEPVFLQHETAAPTATQTVADRQIVLTLTPGGPGVNTYDILITLGNAPEEALDVRLQWVNPDRDWRGQWQQAETVDSGLYITAGDEIDRQGHWWALLDISDSTEISTRVAFDWTISTEASVPQTRDPTVLNGIALAGVALALGWVSYPTVRRYAPLFDFNRTNVTAALSILLITGLLGALSIGLLQEQDRRYRETLNPPPDVINTILPDAASLERGAALYARHCIEWQSSSRDFSALRNRLATMRDDALYAVTRDGWRSLPPCQGDLSDGQRWDIVNYVRSFAS